MFEKLEKLRGELAKARKKQQDAEEKVRLLEEKLKEAEHTQILQDVGEVNFTPEQLNQFLQLVKEGHFPFPKEEKDGSFFRGKEEENTGLEEEEGAGNEQVEE